MANQPSTENAAHSDQGCHLSLITRSEPPPPPVKSRHSKALPPPSTDLFLSSEGTMRAYRCSRSCHAMARGLRKRLGRPDHPWISITQDNKPKNTPGAPALPLAGLSWGSHPLSAPSTMLVLNEMETNKQEAPRSGQLGD